MKHRVKISPFQGQQAKALLSILVCLFLASSMLLSGCASSFSKKESASNRYRDDSGTLAQSAPGSMDKVASSEGAPAPMEEAEIPADANIAQGGKGGFASVPEPTTSLAPNTPQPTNLFQPQIIKTATVSIKVDNIETEMKTLNGLILKYNGLITNQNLSLAEAGAGYRSGSLEVRIPQAQLDNFLSESGHIGKILSQQVTGQDVGAEIVDNQSRIKNLKAQEEALQAIMKRAGKIPEVLEVSQELARVRGEIEQAQGRVNYLKQQVSYSTVHINLSEENLITPNSSKTDFGTMMENTYKNALNALDDLSRGLVNLGIWFVVFFLPIILAVFGILYLIYKLLKSAFLNCCKKRKEAKSKAAESAEANKNEAESP